MSTEKQGLDQELVRNLANILNDTNLNEIEMEHGDLRIRVSRQPPVIQTVAAPLSAAPALMAAVPQAAPAASDQSAPMAAAPSAKNAVPSPMVGTAYRAAAPTARPFVEIGDEVREGQTLLIIEAMKTMNQIPSPRAGKVTAILFEDSQPVEYGEPLVVIE